MKQSRVSTGQAIILIAVFILILIAFAGLTVDVGMAYGQQRTNQAAANAGAVAGMNSAVLNATDATISKVIADTMTLNGVGKLEFRKFDSGWPAEREKDVTYYHAIYLNVTGERLADVGANPSSRPFAVAASAETTALYIQVITSEDVGTTFASVVGVPKLPVGAQGAAGLGDCLTGIYPVTFHQKYLDADPTRDPYPNAPKIVEDMNLPVGDPGWAGSLMEISRDSTDVGSPGGFLFIRWNGDKDDDGAGGKGALELRNGFTGSGNLALGFSEKTPPPTGYTNGPKPRILEKGDWVASKTGMAATLKDQFDFHINNKTIMILPIHDNVTGNGANSAFRISQFVKVRLLAYKNQGQKSTLTFGLVARNAACVASTPPPCSGDCENPPVNKLTVTLDEELLWYNPAKGVSNYDIAIVQDYSASMHFCWAADVGCSFPNRRIDKALPVLRSFVYEMLVRRAKPFPEGIGAQNRLAYVTFGHKNADGKVVAKQRIAFNDNTATTLAEFKNLIGDTTTPKDVAPGEMNGNTPTADGLAQAITLLNNGRKVDSNGNPVKLVVLLITDGLTNVRFDGKSGSVSQYGVPNTWFATPRCGEDGKKTNQRSDIDMDNPFVQATCPNKGNTSITPPIQAAVNVAQAAQANNISFFAVVLGFQDGRTIQDLQLDKIAPGEGNAVMADSPAQLDNLVKAIGQKLGGACEEYTLTRPAAGASVTIYQQETGAPVGTFSPNSNGILSAELGPGSYRLEAAHMNVVAPTDPLNLARNYNLLTTTAMNIPSPALNFVMPDSNYTHDKVTLNLNKATSPSASCPK